MRTKTLKTLQENRIPREKIYIFVIEEEYEKYKEFIESSYKIVVGKKGLVPQREFAEEYFGEGQEIVFMDDDIEEVFLNHSSLFKGKTLDYFFKYAFKTCKEEQSSIWGVYPVNNPFYLKGAEITIDLKYIVGALYGIINRPHNKKLKLELTRENGQKEDVERTLKYYILDGKVVRFNRVSFKTKYYGSNGGLGTFNERLEPMRIASEKLKKVYGNYGDIKTRPNGMTEFVLKRKPITGGKITEPIDTESNDIIVDTIPHTEKIQKLQSKIVSLLNEVKIPKTDWGREAVIGKGYTFSFGAGKRKFRSNGEFKANTNYPELFQSIVEYANAILPTGFEYEIITVNKNLKAKKHTDKYNNGIGFITMLGDYTGGGLYIYEKGKPKLYDTHNTLLGFNGAIYPHRTEPFKGTRYTLIFYKQTGEKVKGVTMEGSGIKIV